MAPQAPVSSLSASIALAAGVFGLTMPQAGLPSTLPIAFDSVQNLEVFTGQYTPNDDLKVIAAGLSLTSPNFIFLIVDGVANVSTNNLMLRQLPVNKTVFATLTPIAGGASPIDSITLDGSTLAPYPMVQGTPVNYTLIIGQAVIS